MSQRTQESARQERTLSTEAIELHGLYGRSNLTDNQLMTWVEQTLNPDALLYNVTMTFAIDGHVDPKTFQDAFQELIDRSDALRTVIEEIDDIPQQRVLPQLSYGMDFIDLCEASDPQATFREWLDERCARPFKLEERLFDVALIKVADEQFIWYQRQHRLIADEWSTSLIYERVTELYEGKRNGDVRPLPSFQDYVEAERAFRQSPEFVRADAYWREKQVNPVKSLNLYGKGLAQKTAHKERVIVDLGAERSQRLREIAGREDVYFKTLDVSLLNIFHALLFAYLYRISGNHRLAIGSVFHGRSTNDLKETIGSLTKVLPLQVEVVEGATFLSLIEKVGKEVASSRRHAHAVMRAVYQGTNEVTLNYDNVNYRDFCGLPTRREVVHTGYGSSAAGSGLDLLIRYVDGRFLFHFDFNRDVFDETQRKRAVEHFMRIVDGFIADRTRPISQINLLSEEERQLLVEWNDTDSAYVQDKCVHHLFENQVAETPDATAIQWAEQRLTYRELNGRANQLAHYLQTLGVGPETLVGISMERSIEMMVAVLGILKAGGAYVPLDPAYPRERLAFMLEDTKASVLLTQQSLAPQLPQHDAAVICLDTEWKTIAQASHTNPASGVRTDNLAYIIYTSGSTGTPKGVMIEHRSLVNHNLGAIERYGLQANDRVLQFASISFDVAAEELFPTWLSGATVVLWSDQSLAVSAFLEFVEKEELTVLNLPTPYWHEWVAEVASLKDAAALTEDAAPLTDAAALRKLRLVVVGSDKALPERFVRWRQIVGDGVAWLNAYGPTEATITATVYEPQPQAAIAEELYSVPIGRPMANTQIYLLDEHLQAAPIGVPGEIYIGGAGVARGYLNRPQLTAETFIADPFGQETGARLYRTGDLARWLPDGNIAYLGRGDHQVKIRGVRIELGEIEAVLNGHRAVQSAVVVCKGSGVVAPEDGGQEKYLAAYVVPGAPTAPTGRELRAWLQERLPQVMVPSAFVLLDELPMTPNGKIDRRALPAPDLGAMSREQGYVAPRTPVEEVLAEMWARILKLEQVGVEDNFFELGGHSLLATRVVSRVREAFGVEIALRQLFEAPTVAGLANCVEEGLRSGEVSEAPEIRRVARDGELPLSFSQERIWLVDRLQPGSAAYNVPVAFRGKGMLDTAVLKRCFNELVRRHEVLRTTIGVSNGQPVQQIAAELEIDLPVIDLRDLPKMEREAHLQRLLNEHARRPFDLAQGPLLRVVLFCLDDDEAAALTGDDETASLTEHVILVTMHHVISDDWSVNLFWQELSLLYRTFVAGKRNPLQELPIQFVDYAAWQRAYFQGEALEKQLAYWRERLAGVPMLDLPTDYPRPAVQSYSGATETLTLEKTVLDAVRQLSREENATPFITLLSVFMALLYRYTRQEDMAIGVAVANRHWLAGEKLIGALVNTLVLRNDLSGDLSFRELVRRTRQVALEAYMHQDLPFEKLVTELQPERTTSHAPLFQIGFNYINAAQINAPQGQEWEEMAVDRGAAQLDVTMTVMAGAASLTTGAASLTTGGQSTRIELEYNTDLFSKETMRRMLGHYVTMLEAAVNEPDRRVTDLAVLTRAEWDQITLWNDTESPYAKDQCIHQLFEAQVEQSPDATAVIFGDKQLTYRELNRQANRLAHHLQAMGVGPDTLVGICVERSLEMVVGILGVLKAGGAYVPLDPVYPKERLAFMLADAQAPVLLTQERLLAELPEHEARTVCLDRDRHLIDRESEKNPVSGVTLGNLAYVIYTSGSTGKPKGVLVEHRGLGNLAKAQIEAFHVKADSRVLQFASFSFDAAVSEVAMALLAGATLCLATQGELMPGAPLSKLLREQAITTVTLPPSALAVMPAEDFPQLETIISAGEACSADIVARWSQGRRFINAYGPAEATVCATAGVCSSGEQIPPIGHPIANTQVYILDEHLKPVPVGVPGELFIGGVGLARGYMNRPQMTAEKFIFHEELNARLYRTGDLARYLPGGDIVFLGRVDHQVKVRGYRIEPGEIEALLEKHPEVGEALVVAHEDKVASLTGEVASLTSEVASLTNEDASLTGDKRLVAYLVADREAAMKGQTPNGQAPAATDGLELWPSVAEYYVYDELLYSAMSNDDRRNDSYKVAINGAVKDKVVVDIGTGKDAILSRFCVEAGAKRVYAIELLEETYKQAQACIKSLGLEDKITLIHGDSTKVELPEKVDVCVSEIVGAIGGAEGAAEILNNARRFLKDDGVMIPERSLTKIAAITLPEAFLSNPRFSTLPAHYVKEIFAQIGHMFDLRVCLKGISSSNLISTVETFEDLDFTRPMDVEYAHEVSFTMTKDAKMAGFVVWLNLHTVAGEVIDILEHEHSWLPVYFPVFYPGIAVSEGDRIEATIRGTICENGLNLDYHIEGRLLRKNGGVSDFEYSSFHFKESYKATPFYSTLFASDGVKAGRDEGSQLSHAALRSYLKSSLPDFMIPSHFVVLDAFPLSPNGKVDRRALPTPDGQRPDLRASYIAPQSQVEQTIATIWQEALRVNKVGVDDNFFDLGGHSLLVAQVHDKLCQALGLDDLPLMKLFQYATVSALAQYLSNGRDGLPSGRAIGERAARQKAAVAQRRAAYRKRRAA